MITTTYNYSTGSGFVYDMNKITFIGGMAELSLISNPGQSFVPDISASTYDNTKLVYSSGALKQIDLRPANATYYASWATTINANWSSGSSVVTAFGGAAVTGGALVLTPGQYVTFPATANADSAEQGTITFDYTPQYSGSPSANQVLLSINDGNSQNNLLQLFHGTDEVLVFTIFDSAGDGAVAILSSWIPVSGTKYTFVVQYDGIGGTSSIFINGSLFDSVTGRTFTRTIVTTVNVGQQYDGTLQDANFDMANLAFYSAVVTPSSEVLNPTIYDAASAALPLFTYAGLGDVQAFTALSITDANGPGYTLNGMYWNGSAWVTSNGTFAQSNSATIAMGHIATLAASDTLQVAAIYPAGNSQAALSALTATYTGQLYPTTGPILYANAPLTMDSLISFTDVNTHPTNTHLYWYLKIGGVPYWWNGTVWAISNGTITQANPSGTIQTNANTLPISLGAYVVPVAILYSSDGLETPTLISLTVSYDYFGPQPTPPNTCTVFGYIVDEKENPIVGASITAINPTTYINSGIVVAQGQRTVVTDSLGYFSISLIETASLSGSNPVTFNIAYTQSNVGTGFTPTSFSFGAADVPNMPTANFASLSFL